MQYREVIAEKRIPKINGFALPYLDDWGIIHLADGTKIYNTDDYFPTDTFEEPLILGTDDDGGSYFIPVAIPHRITEMQAQTIFNLWTERIWSEPAAAKPNVAMDIGDKAVTYQLYKLYFQQTAIAALTICPETGVIAWTNLASEVEQEHIQSAYEAVMQIEHDMGPIPPRETYFTMVQNPDGKKRLNLFVEQIRAGHRDPVSAARIARQLNLPPVKYQDWFK